MLRYEWFVRRWAPADVGGDARFLAAGESERACSRPSTGEPKPNPSGLRGRSVAAMVLSAGLGTRLGPLGAELPKPLMPVGDRSVLDHVIDRLAASELARVVINTHHRPDAFEAWLTARNDSARRQGRWPLPEVMRVHEADVLGTAGGVAHAAAELGAGEVVVWNGDILADELDLGALASAHDDHGCVVTWVVAPRPRGEGTVGLDERGRIVRLRGRMFGIEAAGADYVGIQWLSHRARARLPSRGCLTADLALPLLSQNEPIATYLYRGPWTDIGRPEALLDANLAWLARRQRNAWLGEGARAGMAVALHRVVLARGAEVEGEGALARVLVLPGARARAPLSSAIVGRTATVSVPDASE